ncbi:ArnT family glycosyltransferase [Desulfovibrio cuneatus]|uniref:ArnT family glycosyltransferase n=1 Tax=Desulfovibrio cuneatus TaxID=159728 RepID=UPI0003F4EA93|nr:hypothetical protein [Desulfovibrio cuneatus]
MNIEDSSPSSKVVASTSSASAAPAPEKTVAQVIAASKHGAQPLGATQTALLESEAAPHAALDPATNPILDGDTLLMGAQPMDTPLDASLDAPFDTPLDASYAAYQHPITDNSHAETATAPASSPVVAEPPFFAQRPIMRVESTLPPSGSSKLFGVLAYAPFITLVALVVLQTIFTLDARDLWYSDEIRHADAFRNLLDGGKWLVLEMNGQPYPDKPPLYFLFLRALYEVLPAGWQSIPVVFFVGAALSGVLFMLSTLVLGRGAGRADGKTLLGAGLLLLSTGYIMGLLHYGRMDFLFAALITLSFTAFFIAVGHRRSMLWMVLAYFAAGLACLVKGPLGLALPLLATLVFTVWRGTPGRLFRRDSLMGFAVAVLVVGAWAAGVSYTMGGPSYFINVVLKEQVLARAVNTFHHKEQWHYYLVRLPLALLPWSIIVLCLPWGKVLLPSFWKGVLATRKPEAEGTAFLVCIVLATLGLLSLLSGKIVIYFLPALPALAILAARAVLGFGPMGAAMLRYAMAVFMAVAGVAGVVGTLMLYGTLPMPALGNLPAWHIPPNVFFFAVSLLFLGAAALLVFGLGSNRPEGVLLLMTLCATLASYPLAKYVAPAFNAILSPKPIAQTLKSYVEAGYMAFTHNDYGGTYTFYAEQVVPEISLENLAQKAEQGTRVVVAMKRKRFDKWADKPACFTPVYEQWIENSRYVLAACPPLGQEIPQPLPQEAVVPPIAPIAPIVPQRNGTGSTELEKAVPPESNGPDLTKPTVCEPPVEESPAMQGIPGEQAVPQPTGQPAGEQGEPTEKSEPAELKDFSTSAGDKQPNQ